MSAFHSGTDDNDLYTTAQKLPIFLSLVVNYACNTHCKLAIGTEGEEVEVTLTRTNWKLKGWKHFKKEKNKRKVTRSLSKTYTVLCDVVYEQDDWLVDQCDELSKKKKFSYYTKPTYQTNTVGFQQNPNGNTPTGSEIKAPLHKRPQYSVMLDKVCDLVTLGVVQKMTPYLAIQKVNLNTSVNDKEDYMKALKNYFKETWFDETFYHYTSFTEVEAIEMIESFMSLHEKMYAHSIIVPPLIELKNEYKKEQQLV